MLKFFYGAVFGFDRILKILFANGLLEPKFSTNKIGEDNYSFTGNLAYAA